MKHFILGTPLMWMGYYADTAGADFVRKQLLQVMSPENQHARRRDKFPPPWAGKEHEVQQIYASTPSRRPHPCTLYRGTKTCGRQISKIRNRNVTERILLPREHPLASFSKVGEDTNELLGTKARSEPLQLLKVRILFFSQLLLKI